MDAFCSRNCFIWQSDDSSIFTSSCAAAENWERLAYTAFQDEYEGAALNDYHYIGRTQVNEEQTKDVFRVTVKEGSTRFAAHAEIYFHPVTGHLISINVFRL